MTDEQYEPLEHCVEILKTVASDYRKALARIAELEAENEELKKAISKPWMGSARAAYLGEK